LNAEERERIESWGRSLQRDVTLAVLTTKDPRSDEVRRFADALRRLTGRVELSVRSADDDAPPGLLPHDLVAFSGVPLGRELPPFLELLSSPRATDPISDPIAPLPHVQLFVAQSCPNCPRVVSELWPLAADGRFQLHVIDASLFAERAEARGVRSVPTLVLERGLRLTGPISGAEIVALLERPGSVESGLLGRLLEQGNAEPLARLFHEHGVLPPTLVELLAEPAFQTRLGAMALVESLVERSRTLARSLVEPLWERVDDAIDEVRGDLLYLIGEVGGAESVARLRGLSDRGYAPDVEEAAAEALQAIETRLAAERD
jgi:hypothetical protein